MVLENIRTTLGLTRMPFSKQIHVGDLFESASMRDALARLDAAIENEDTALLTGQAGTGKSCVLRKFISQLDEKFYRMVYLSAECLKPGDIAKQILTGLAQEAPFHGTRAIRELKRYVASCNIDKGFKPVVVIDEAQELPMQTLIALKTFVNYEMDSRNYLFVLLCGQPEIEALLRTPVMESLSRRIRIRCRVKPLALEETSKYVRHQMKRAGMERQYFSDEAVARIYEYSRGITSSVNHFCFSALALAVSEGKEIVDPAMIESLRGEE